MREMVSGEVWAEKLLTKCKDLEQMAGLKR